MFAFVPKNTHIAKHPCSLTPLRAEKIAASAHAGHASPARQLFSQPTENTSQKHSLSLPIISPDSPYLYSVVDRTSGLGRRGFGDLALGGRHPFRRPFFLEPLFSTNCASNGAGNERGKLI
jgi:hypothetical protein